MVLLGMASLIPGRIPGIPPGYGVARSRMIPIFPLRRAYVVSPEWDTHGVTRSHCQGAGLRLAGALGTLSW